MSSVPPPLPVRPAPRHWLRVIAWPLAIFLAVDLIVLWFLFFESRRQLATYRAELKARGEPLTFAELLPPPVADQDNFFADPLWEEIVETKKPGGQEYTPRVPKENQQLAQASRPISEHEAAALQQAFPTLKDLAVPGKRAEVMNKAAERFDRTIDPVRRKELASFLLAVLEPAAPILARIEVLAKRPSARFRELDWNDSYAMRMPHIPILITLGQEFSARARARVALGNHADAARDIQTVFRLSDTVKGDPNVLSQLVRVAILQMTPRPIDAGVVSHHWNAAELDSFAQAAPAGFSHDLLRSLRGERAGFNQICDSLRRHSTNLYEQLEVLGSSPTEHQGPAQQIGSLIYVSICLPWDQLFGDRLIQSWIDDLRSTDRFGYSDFGKKFDLQDKSMLFKVTKVISSVTLSALSGTQVRFAYSEVTSSQVRIVCALEKYFLQHREYPADLTALVPDYLTAIPVDAITLGPMHYERTAPGQFKLWSVGWNRIDEHGAPMAKKNIRSGDIVWPARTDDK